VIGNLTEAGETEALLQVESIIENRTTYNVIAQTIGGDQNNVLAVGAHSDSVFAGPGINDDGSGTIGILETALQLSKFRTNNAVRFCFWSAEEFGLLGSTYYTQNLSSEEAEKIKLYLNYDMIASPNYVIALYDGDGSAFNLTGPPGSAEAEQFLAKYFADLNIPTTETDFDGRSDYGPFLDIGIPAGGIFTGAEELKTAEEAALFGGEAGVAYDVNYHQAGDSYSNLNFEAFTINSKAIAASVAHYSTSFKTLPPRDREYEVTKRSSQHSHPHARSLRAKNVHAKHDCGAAPKETI
jgi:carboxypeptidase Q